MSSMCNFPTIGVPTVPNIPQIIISLLENLGISIPALPNIPLPIPICPLD